MKYYAIVGCVFLSIFMPLPIGGYVAQSSSPECENNITPRGLFNLAYSFYCRDKSLEPDSVVVGKNHWLFLGDSLERVYSEAIRQNVVIHTDKIDQAHAARRAWKRYLNQRDIAYFVQTLPNKHRVYSNYLPQPVNEEKQNNTDAFMQRLNAEDNNYLYELNTLLRHKREALQLYFQTDTHWNELAGFYAYQDLMGLVNGSVAIEYISDRPDIETQTVRGGDLANMLGISELIRDTNVRLRLPQTQTQEIGYFSDDAHYSGENRAIGNTSKPILVHTEGALNDKKVLWLHDSFGLATSRLMHLTFSRVLHQHFDFAMQNGAADFLKLLEEFQPDIVIVSHVERALLNDSLAVPPPINDE